MKPFIQFLAEADKTWTVKDFPHILASLNLAEPTRREARQKYLERTVVGMNRYGTGDVPNPEFIAFKDVANRTVEAAQKYPDFIYTLIRGRQVNFNIYDAQAAYSNNVPGKLKKAEAEAKRLAHDADAVKFYGWLIPILKDLLPISAAVESAKARAVKRQPKAPEDQHAKYVAPMASHASGKLVIAALTEITQKIYEDYATAVTDWLMHEAQTVAALSYEDQQRSKSEIRVIHRIWNKGDFYEKRPATLVDGYQKVLVSEGRNAAKAMQEHFVFKNAKKLASIIQAKRAPLKGKPTILSASTAGRGVFEGILKLTFTDGSAFEVKNQVVFKWNQYGTHFTQYPTTFHNVILPNGTRMSQPSEERMNTVFAIA